MQLYIPVCTPLIFGYTYPHNVAHLMCTVTKMLTTGPTFLHITKYDQKPQPKMQIFPQGSQKNNGSYYNHRLITPSYNYALAITFKTLLGDYVWRLVRTGRWQDLNVFCGCQCTYSHRTMTTTTLINIAESIQCVLCAWWHLCRCRPTWTSLKIQRKLWHVQAMFQCICCYFG